MDVAARSHLTTGVAFVGATAIALAPLQIAPPDVYIRSDRIVSQTGDVSLSALSDVIAALETAWRPVATGINTAVSGSQAAITTLGDALQATLVNGLSQGNTAFQSLVNGLLDQGGALAVAIDNVIAAAPSPSAFITALTSGFAQINANLAGALQMALQAALNVNVGLDATAIAHALQNTVATLAAQFNAAVAAFPTPAAFVAALTGALTGAIPGLDAAAAAAQAAVTALSNALANTINAGIATGNTALQAVIDGLVNGSGQLATAFQNVIAAFPTPQAFINALVASFARINPNLAVQIFVALQAMINVNANVDLAAIGTALANAGAQLAAAFNAAVAGFPTPQAFAAALSGALSTSIPAIAAVLATGQTAIANLAVSLAMAINAGLAAGSTAFQSVINGLNTVGSQLQMAFQTALAAFPSPQAFVNALMSAFNQIGVGIGVGVNLALQAVVNVGAMLNTTAIVNALENAGANLTAAFNSVVASFPTPQAFAAALNSALAPALAGVNMAIADGQKLVTNLATTLTNGLNVGAAALLATLATFPSPEVIAAGLARAVADLQTSLQAGLSSLPSVADAMAAAQILSASINRAVGDIAGIGTTAVTEFSDAFRNTAVTALNNGADVMQAVTTGLVAALARLTRTELPAGNGGASLAATVQASVVNLRAGVTGVATDEVASTKVVTGRPLVTLPVTAPAPTLAASPAKTQPTVGQGLAAVGSQVQGAITTSEKQTQKAANNVGKQLQTAGDNMGKQLQTAGDNIGKQIGSTGDNAGKQIGSAAAGVQKTVGNAVKALTPKPPKKPAKEAAKSSN